MAKAPTLRAGTRLARAFMRTANSGDAREAETDGNEGPQLLILDEPTAALDAEAKYQLFTRFRELTRDRATLIISHRFSTVTMADLILVLEHGKIIERGSHDELMALGQRYATLYDMQAARYR